MPLDWRAKLPATKPGAVMQQPTVSAAGRTRWQPSSSDGPQPEPEPEPEPEPLQPSLSSDEEGTDYASSDDGAMPFSDEPHTDHFGTFSHEGDSFAPLVETPRLAVRRMLELARLQRTERLVDVGCGDGRFVVDAAEHFGCEAVGIDLFDDRLSDAAALAAEKKVTDRTRFLQADAREFDFSSFDVVVVFLLPAALATILPQLRASVARGARVASYWFPIEGLMEDPTVAVTTDPSGEMRVFVYSTATDACEGRGQGGRDLGLKHEVSADRAGAR